MSNQYQIVIGEDRIPECIVQLTRGFQMRCSPDDYIRFVMEFGDVSLHLSNGYAFFIKKRTLYFHSWLMGFPKKPLMVSHIDADGLNNWQWNLEICTKSHNLRNLNDTLRNDTISGYRGVSWEDDRQKWEARIQVQNRTIHLGRFDTFDEAVAARESAEEKYGYYH